MLLYSLFVLLVTAAGLPHSALYWFTQSALVHPISGHMHRPSTVSMVKRKRSRLLPHSASHNADLACQPPGASSNRPSLNVSQRASAAASAASESLMAGGS